MNIRIFTPGVGRIRTGNSRTANQWANILRSLGHEVAFYDKHDGSVDAHCLLALHANKSREVAQAFCNQHPDGILILALTGTDIYPEPNNEALETMAAARFLVVLQDLAKDQIPHELRSRTHVIIQSVRKSQTEEADDRSDDPFLVSVIGHLRDVKDPMRAAIAARQLPARSKIQIHQLGAILEPKYYHLIEQEKARNDRFQYWGEQSEEQVRQIIKRSQATVLSSFNEGGARVIGESVVEGTPVIGTRIPGVVGLVGEDYPALFSPGNTSELIVLLNRLEQDNRFRKELRSKTKKLALKFDPAREKEAWRRLLS